jgi:hypothetical protein
MNIVPVHYRNSQDSRISRCEVETFEDVSRVIIDEFEKRYIIDVDDDGTVSCRTCDGDDCGHETKIRERLRTITGKDEYGDTDEGTVMETGTAQATADD